MTEKQFMIGMSKIRLNGLVWLSRGLGFSKYIRKEVRNMEELWDDYLQYLIWRGRLERMTKYGRLFDILHHIDFICVVERDENREADGVELRDDYNIPDDFDDCLVDDFLERPCSVLEMMIALAIKVDDEFIGDPAEEHPEEFFMEMIKNLGLDKFRGNRYKESDVIRIIDRWLNREFDRDGTGSPFPVKESKRDQRELEIWDQMNAYLRENYDY